MTRRFLSLTGLAAVLLIPQHSVSAAKPRTSNITDLGTLGGPNSSAFGINNDPDLVRVVGWSHIAGRSGAYHAFYWVRGGPMTDLGTLGGNTSRAQDVNNHGQVVGQSRDPDWQEWGTVWTQDTRGVWRSEKLPAATPGLCCTNAVGISNGIAGDPASVVIVGVTIREFQGSQAAKWTHSAAGWGVQALGALPGDSSSFAFGVNDNGAIVGVSQDASNVGRGFHWDPTGGMVELPSLDGNTVAMAINNAGEGTGSSTDGAGNAHAVRWTYSVTDQRWVVEDLGTLADGCCSVGHGINSRGDVVGWSNTTPGTRRVVQHAFLAAPGSQGLADLGALGRNSAAWDVNDANVVVGESGSNHAVVWN
jgi:probable HAF family extracellular repeat protein